MIPPPATWIRRNTAETTVFLKVVDGVQVAALRYRERVRPLRPMRTITSEIVAARRLFTETARLHPERLLTAEGEYAAHTVVQGLIGDRPAELHVGCVFGDDFQSVLEGLVTQQELFATCQKTVRQLLTMDSLGLGVRRRRYVYAPPAGFMGIPRQLACEWYPPGFPKDPSSITVFPANPSWDTTAHLVEKLVGEEKNRGRVVTERTASERLALRGALTGERFLIALSPAGSPPAQAPAADPRGWSYRDIAVLQDAQYTYCVQLESLSPDGLRQHQESLHNLLQTIEPIPQADVRGDTGLGSQLVGYWME